MLNQKLIHMLHLNGFDGNVSYCAKKSAARWPSAAAPKMLISII